MSQRVVIPTDEQRAKAFRAFWDKFISEGDPDLITNKFPVAFRAGFDAALEHLGRITDEQVGHAQDAYDHTLASANPMRKALEAALEHPGGITDEMVKRARKKQLELSNADNDEIAEALETTDWASHVARQVLEAGLFRVPWEFSKPPANDAEAVPNLPTPEGRALGVELARLADLEEERQREKFPNAKPRCADCAIRAAEEKRHELDQAREGQEYAYRVVWVAEGIMHTKPMGLEKAEQFKGELEGFPWVERALLGTWERVEQ